MSVSTRGWYSGDGSSGHDRPARSGAAPGPLDAAGSARGARPSPGTGRRGARRPGWAGALTALGAVLGTVAATPPAAAAEDATEVDAWTGWGEASALDAGALDLGDYQLLDESALPREWLDPGAFEAGASAVDLDDLDDLDLTAPATLPADLEPGAGERQFPDLDPEDLTDLDTGLVDGFPDLDPEDLTDLDAGLVDGAGAADTGPGTAAPKGLTGKGDGAQASLAAAGEQLASAPDPAADPRLTKVPGMWTFAGRMPANLLESVFSSATGRPVDLGPDSEFSFSLELYTPTGGRLYGDVRTVDGDGRFESALPSNALARGGEWRIEQRDYLGTKFYWLVVALDFVDAKDRLITIDFAGPLSVPDGLLPGMSAGTYTIRHDRTGTGVLETVASGAASGLHHPTRR